MRQIGTTGNSRMARMHFERRPNAWSMDFAAASDGARSNDIEPIAAMVARQIRLDDRSGDLI